VLAIFWTVPLEALEQGVVLGSWLFATHGVISMQLKMMKNNMAVSRKIEGSGMETTY